MNHAGIGAYTSISLDLGNCGGPLRDVEEADRLFSELLEKSGMKKRKTIKDPFESPEGYSYMLIYTLEESMLYVQAFHVTKPSFIVETWPEKNGVKIVIDLCKFQRDNHARAVFLAEGCMHIFAPAEGKLIVKRRTIEDMDGW